MVVECDQDVPEDGLSGWKKWRNHQSDISEESRRKISMEYHSIRQLEELCKTEQTGMEDRTEGRADRDR